MGSERVRRHESRRQHVHRRRCERGSANLGRPEGHEGRFIWYGLSRGANLFATGGTGGTPLKPKPFAIAVDWFRYFLVQSPGFDGTDVSGPQFELLVEAVGRGIRPDVQRDRSDLSAFRDRGGKLIIMHGLADQLIPHEGSIDYYERVQEQMGGAAKAAEFARLFLVPGVDHGFRGPGASPNPNRVFLSLAKWVEEGQAPDQLPGEARDASGKLLRTRPRFPYPQTAKYSGSGDRTTRRALFRRRRGGEVQSPRSKVAARGQGTGDRVGRFPFLVFEGSVGWNAT